MMIALRMVLPPPSALVFYGLLRQRLSEECGTVHPVVKRPGIAALQYLYGRRGER